MRTFLQSEDRNRVLTLWHIAMIFTLPIKGDLFGMCSLIHICPHFEILVHTFSHTITLVFSASNGGTRMGGGVCVCCLACMELIPNVTTKLSFHIFFVFPLLTNYRLLATNLTVLKIQIPLMLRTMKLSMHY